MKQLHSRVNIVPVIGKADTLTQRELHELKKKVIDHKLNLRYTTLCYGSNGDPCELAGKTFKRKPRHPGLYGPKQMFRIVPPDQSFCASTEKNILKIINISNIFGR